MPDCIYVKDSERRFVTTNVAVARLMGAKTPEDLVGKTDLDFYPQELAAQFYADEQEIIRSGQPLINHEESLADQVIGRRGWLSTTKVPLRDSEGKVVGLVGIGHDIIERVQAEERIRRLATQLKAIARPARQMSALLDPDELVQQVVQSLQEITGCYNANFFLHGDDGLVLAAGQGGYEGGGPPLGYRLSLGQGIVGRAAQSGQPMLVPDVSQEPRYVAWEGLPHTHSELAIPVKHGDRVLGVIDMQATEAEGFDTADLEALGVLADQLAVALQNARLYGETQRRASEMTALYETALDLATSGKLEDILQLMARRTVALLQARDAGIYLYDQDADELEWGVAYSAGEEYLGTRLKPGEGLAGKVMQDWQPMVVDDYQTWEGRSPQFDAQPFTAVAAVPMLWQDQLIGVLNVVDDKERRTFDDDDVRLLTMLGQQAAAAIANARSLQAEQKRAAQLATINELGRALAATLDLPTVYRTAYQYVQRLVDCLNFGISLFDPEQQAITAAFMVSEGVEADLSQFPPLSYKPQARTGRSRAIASGHPEIVYDLPRAFQASDQAHLIGNGPDPLSALYVPMIVEGQVIGLLEVQSYRAGAYQQEDVELLTTAANQIGLAIQNARLFEAEHRRSTELAALAQVSSALRTAPTRAEMLPVILDQLLDLLEAEGAALALRDPASGETVIERANGTWIYWSGERLPPGQGISGQVIATGQPYVDNDIHVDPLFGRPDRRRYLKAVACVPLVAQEQTIGAVWIGRQRAISDQEVRLLTAIGDMAANAIQRASLHEQTARQAQELASALSELRDTYRATLTALTAALDARDRETEGHSRRVTELSLAVARAMGLNGRELANIEQGAILHDVGKIGVSDAILRKPGRLTPEEWGEMKEHPEMGYQILKDIRFLNGSLSLIRHHHERWDGRGYPAKLAAEAIPLGARIFAVGDAYDAMTSDRHYRAAMSHEEAIAELRRCAGTQFDPAVVEAFLAILE